ncbi:MAG TPA: hypothetical protein VJU84_10535 [Pyrinomonadaceae bacterium]|nr:hypothetical protein [Pyrinomonadaceae bacterium]
MRYGEEQSAFPTLGHLVFIGASRVESETLKRIVLQRTVLLLVAFTSLLFAANMAQAQDQHPPEYVERLRGPAATVRGGIGGESHDSYVIRARKGQIMTVRLSWRRERSELGENHAQFYVAELPEFSGDSAVKFGKESDNGNRWSGKIPKTGDYYIYVMAHPIADYTLRVTVR